MNYYKQTGFHGPIRHVDQSEVTGSFVVSVVGKLVVPGKDGVVADDGGVLGEDDGVVVPI